MKYNKAQFEFFKSWGLPLPKTLFYFAIIVLVIFTSFYTHKKLAYSMSAEKLVSGTMSGNIKNCGFIAQDEKGWIYYADVDKIEHSKFMDVEARTLTYAFYKESPDGKQKIRLNNSYPRYLNIQNGWIYYVEKNDDCKIYRMKADGTSKQKLNDQRSRNVQVVDSWIYYVEEITGQRNIYKMRLDGREKVQITQDLEWMNDIFKIIGGWIYYLDNSDKLCKIKTDGTEKSELIDRRIFNFTFVNDWIYFMDASSLMRMNLGGSGIEQVGKYSLFFSYILDEKIYDCSTDGLLYQINQDGSNKRQISIAKLDLNYKINILGDWIYYYSLQEGYEGMNRVKIER